MPNTKGFLNLGQLNNHFQKHGADFGAVDSADYERLADEFLGGLKPLHVMENKRRSGDLLRFDPTSDAFGILRWDRVIRTFFKPVPCATVAASIRQSVVAAGMCHGEADNLTYYQTECSK